VTWGDSLGKGDVGRLGVEKFQRELASGLSLQLTAHHGGRDAAVLYESMQGVQPKVRLELWTMKRRTSLTTTALSLLLGAAYVAADTPVCASGSTPRFEIVNNCGDDVWVVETPPGNQTQPTVPAQWRSGDTSRCPSPSTSTRPR
jgi:hypothetical protein